MQCVAVARRNVPEQRQRLHVQNDSSIGRWRDIAKNCVTAAGRFEGVQPIRATEGRNRG